MHAACERKFLSSRTPVNAESDVCLLYSDQCIEKRLRVARKFKRGIRTGIFFDDIIVENGNDVCFIKTFIAGWLLEFFSLYDWEW
jgi:hypothetical protein